MNARSLMMTLLFALPIGACTNGETDGRTGVGSAPLSSVEPGDVVTFRHYGGMPELCPGGEASSGQDDTLTLSISDRKLSWHLASGCGDELDGYTTISAAALSEVESLLADIQIVEGHGCGADYGNASVVHQRADGSSDTYFSEDTDQPCDPGPLVDAGGYEAAYARLRDLATIEVQ